MSLPILFAPWEGRGSQSDAAPNSQETQRTVGLNSPLEPGQAPKSLLRRSPSPAHAEMGVRVTVPPRTESSIPVPMATNPVTRQLESNAMSPQLEAMRPIAPDGQVTLHFIHVNWGIDLWPAMFTQASEPDLSTMNHLSELLRSQLLQNMESDATSVD
eukprot:2196924-Pleurochrysis_carterae.AAC.1